VWFSSLTLFFVVLCLTDGGPALSCAADIFKGPFSWAGHSAAGLLECARTY
jgi:hypothetical protein